MARQAKRVGNLQIPCNRRTRTPKPGFAQAHPIRFIAPVIQAETFQGG